MTGGDRQGRLDVLTEDLEARASAPLPGPPRHSVMLCHFSILEKGIVED